MFLLALLLQHFDKTLWLKCHIQWLYLAVHGCKTYLNLNLKGARITVSRPGSDKRLLHLNMELSVRLSDDRPTSR
jgi:hypothetical protein